MLSTTHHAPDGPFAASGVAHHRLTLKFAYMALRAHFSSCEIKAMLGKARAHGSGGGKLQGRTQF